LAPLYGNGRRGLNDIQNGRLAWGVANLSLAALDLTLIPAVFRALGGNAAFRAAEEAASEAAAAGEALEAAAVAPAAARTPVEWKIPIDEGGAINAIGKAGEIEIVGNLSRSENRITVDGVHFTKNAGGTLGPKQLQDFGRDFLRQHGNGATELVINPAPRTSGATAGTGVAPKPITIKLE
jgi:hypothetical protein